jgi:hypothetical protein
VAFQRGIDGPDPGPLDPIADRSGPQEERHSARSTRVASGTLACPSCDAPVTLARGAASPASVLGCPFCDHTAPLREFLSLRAPTRPTRVEVHVVLGR